MAKFPYCTKPGDLDREMAAMACGSFTCLDDKTGFLFDGYIISTFDGIHCIAWLPLWQELRLITINYPRASPGTNIRVAE